MSEYANQETKRIIMSLAGCVGFADVLLKNDKIRNHANARGYLYAMKCTAEKAMDAIMNGLDEDQKQGIMRFAGNCELMCLPKTDPRCGQDCYLISEKDIVDLLSSATQDCAFCELEGHDLKECKIRKALVRCGVIGINQKDCPYKG